MNAQQFSEIETLAQKMLTAAENDDEGSFYALYDELESRCQQVKGSSKDHPVLWETLGDFSEEFDQAIAAYEQAFKLASELKDNEYKGSIQYALAQRYLEEGQQQLAEDALAKAEKFAGFTEDTELQEEITQLKAELR